MTITRADAHTTERLRAIFPAWWAATSSIDDYLWVQRFPGGGWIPLKNALDERWSRAFAEARETAEPADEPLSDIDAIERARDILIMEETSR